MKLAISAAGNTIDAPFDARFGRAAAFCIVDTETGRWEAKENPAASVSGGAGIQASQFLANLGVQAVVSGAFGPNALEVLRTAEVAMYSVPSGVAATVEEVLAMYGRGELGRVDEAGETRDPGGGRGW